MIALFLKEEASKNACSSLKNRSICKLFFCEGFSFNFIERRQVLRAGIEGKELLDESTRKNAIIFLQ